MKILITGGSGRLGKHLVKEFADAVAPSSKELDITNRKHTLAFLQKIKPELVIHCAAWVDVRAAQDNEVKAWKVNVEGTENAVDAAMNANPLCYFVYPSTACVFSGEKGDYTEKDVPNPKNYYGFTKVVAEEAVKKCSKYLIARTDFVDRAKWRYEGAFIDRFSTCIFADTLAKAFKKVIEKQVTGLIHRTGKKKISHFDLAKLTTPEVKPIKLSDVDIPLPRDQSLKSVKGWDILELE